MPCFFSCTVLKCREFLFPLFLQKKTPIGNICPGEKKKLAQVSTGEAITSFPGRVQVGWEQSLETWLVLSPEI